MKTTVKTFWICMLLMLTCSISGKAIDLVQWMTEWPELLKFPLLYLHVLLLPTIVLTRRIHCSRIPSSHGLRMSNWETNRFPKLTLLINSVCAGWLKTIFSSETFFDVIQPRESTRARRSKLYYSDKDPYYALTGSDYYIYTLRRILI